MLRPRRRYQPPPLYRRNITPPRVLMAVAAVAAVAGIVVLLGNHSSSPKASDATTTSSGFGGIPGAGSSTSEASGPSGQLGVGAWCNQLYQIQFEASPIGFYVKAGDFAGFRAAIDDLVPRIDLVAQQAPAGVHDAMAQVAKDADNLRDVINKATSFDAATTQLSNSLLPAIQNGAPAIAWIQANCPTNPNTTTTSTTAPAPPT